MFSWHQEIYSLLNCHYLVGVEAFSVVSVLSLFGDEYLVQTLTCGGQ